MLARFAAYFTTFKSIAGMVGAGLTAAGGIAGAPVWLLAIGAILTGVALWELPYQPAPREVG